MEDLKYFEKKNKIKINIKNTVELNVSEYLIEFKSKSEKVLDKIEKTETLQKVVNEKSESKLSDKKPYKKDFKKRKFKKRKFFKKKTK